MRSGRPFEAGGGRVAGLELESDELFRLDNPYWDDDPAVFARGYVRSVTAWGGPLLLRAFAREGEERAPGLLADFLGELEERVADGPRPLPLGLHRGPRHLPEGGRHRARPDALRSSMTAGRHSTSSAQASSTASASRLLKDVQDPAHDLDVLLRHRPPSIPASRVAT